MDPRSDEELEYLDASDEERFDVSKSELHYPGAAFSYKSALLRRNKEAIKKPMDLRANTKPTSAQRRSMESVEAQVGRQPTKYSRGREQS